jgi:hypothetical protein
MIWYKPQSMNPDKHELLPDGYPWQVSMTEFDGSIEISEIDYEILINSFDLTLYNKEIQIAENLDRQKTQREFGLYLVPELIDMMGERNLTLLQNGESVNITAIASDNAGIKLLIETGALSTAREICSQLKLKYPLHTDIYDHVIEDITEFLNEKGY